MHEVISCLLAPAPLFWGWPDSGGGWQRRERRKKKKWRIIFLQQNLSLNTISTRWEGDQRGGSILHSPLQTFPSVVRHCWDLHFEGELEVRFQLRVRQLRLKCKHRSDCSWEPALQGGGGESEKGGGCRLCVHLRSCRRRLTWRAAGSPGCESLQGRCPANQTRVEAEEMSTRLLCLSH